MFLTETGLIYRGIRPLQKLGSLALNNPFSNIQMPQKIPDGLLVVPPDPWAGDAIRGRDMIAGVFHFVGQTIEKEQISWFPDTAKPEWISVLHGFEWLRDLRSVGGDRARKMAREMVTNWIDRYQKPCDRAWAPDVTGVRVSAWISFHDFFVASADDEFRKHYFISLVRQARHLSRALPGTLSGIPLMRALKGLAYTGLALEDGEERLEQAFDLILRQIREQVLPDGGHVSRSPQAAFEFLQVLVDLRSALNAARLEMPEELQHAIDRIAPAVKFFRHGCGAFAQFNGSQEGNSNICDATLMHSGARGKAMKSLPHTGYEKICQGRAAVIMDTGVAHGTKYSDRAHAGLLSFEYSFGKDRVIVNCGTSGVRGKWRDMLRSTAAHSTLVVDNRNACQFDEQGVISSQPEIRAKRMEDQDIALIEGSHTGYVPRFGLTHRRCVRLMECGEVLAGEDQLTGKSGVHYAVRFHLHPSIQATVVGNEVMLRSRSGMGWKFRAEGAVDIALEDSVYAGEGEAPRKSLQIVLNGISTGGATNVAWTVKREKP
jgi:uncharacterized heparinase superfamily protein